MDKIIELCRRYLVDKILDSGKLIMKAFQNQTRKRFRIAPAIVGIFKEDIFLMVDIDFTYIQVVEPQKTFLDPLGYELTNDIAG